MHDFIDKDLGKAIPYGVYDIAKNKEFVSVGIDHDTAEFAVQTGHSAHRHKKLGIFRTVDSTGIVGNMAAIFLNDRHKIGG